MAKIRGTGTSEIPSLDLTTPLAVADGGSGLTSRQVIHVRDEKTANTAGGTNSSGDNIRTLNTIVTNTITGASLGTNKITLPIGTYEINASSPAAGVDRFRARLLNVTTSSIILLGTCEYGVNPSGAGRSVIQGTFTLASQSEINILLFTSTINTTNGLGLAINDGYTEVYTSVFIQKVG